MNLTRTRITSRTAAAALLAALGVAACGGGGGGAPADGGVRIRATTLPPATAGVEYVATLDAVVPHPPATHFVASGLLPVGLVLDETTGVISGIPRASGTFRFVAAVRDGVDTTLPPSRDVTFAEARNGLAIEVARGVPRILPIALPTGEYRRPYTTTVPIAGGTPPYAVRRVSGDLPRGLALASDGTVSGVPLEATGVPRTVELEVSDREGLVAVGSVELHVVVPPLSILTPNPFPPGARGFRYGTALALATGGGGPPYRWEQLPVGPGEFTLASIGLYLTPDGEVRDLGSGPTSAGSFRFSLRVTDEALQTATRSYTMQVNEGPVLSSVTPDHATSPGPYVVSGLNFQPGATLVLRPGVGQSVVGLEYRSPTTLEFRAPFPMPSGAAGWVDATVVNPDGGSSTLSNAFAFPATDVRFGAKGFVPSALSSTGLDVADVNGDRRADLVHAGSASVTAVANTTTSSAGGLIFHRNLGGSPPAFSSTLLDGGNWTGVKFCDVDTDGDLDVVALGHSAVRTWLGDGAGGFTPGPTSPLPGPGAPAFPSELTIGRLDGGGVLDLAFGVPNFSSLGQPNQHGRVYTMLGTGTGAFTVGPSATTTVPDVWGVLSLAAIDLDADGRSEVVAGVGLNVTAGSSLRLGRLSTTPTFSSWNAVGSSVSTPVFGSTTSVVAGAFVTPGVASLLSLTSGVPTYSNSQIVRTHSGPLLASELDLPPPGTAAKCATRFDADFDLLDDVAITCGQGTIVVYRMSTRSIVAQLDAAVGSPTVSAPRLGRIASGDLDGDGRPDLVATTSYWAVNGMASRQGTSYPMGNTGNGGSMGLVYFLSGSQ